MKFVNFFLAVFILLASLLPNMDTNELTKFTELVDHYQLHQKKCNFQGNFLDFLNLHYGSTNNDGHDHRNLPFKNCQHSFDYYFSNLLIQVEPTRAILSDLGLTSPFYNSIFISTFSANIWQPPKI